MTIGTHPLATTAGSSLAAPQVPSMAARAVGLAGRADSLPGAPAGLLTRTQAGSMASGLPPRGASPAQCQPVSGAQSGPPLLPYPLLPGAASLGKVLVPCNEEFSSQRQAEITAWQIVVGAALQGMQPRFAGRLPDHVFVDTQQFGELAQATRQLAGDPGKYPVFLDQGNHRLVMDASRSFAHDDLTAPARKGLAAVLGTAESKGNKSDDPTQPVMGGRRLAEFSRKERAGTTSPVAKAGTLPAGVPPYVGKKTTSATQGADFYKENLHPLFNDKDGWMRGHLAAFTHKNYLLAGNPKALGTDLVSHRGVIDNRNGVPENSIAALDNAYRLGFRSIELDIQVTADKVPVLIHDFTLGRMTDDPANRLVSHVKFAELSKKELVIRNPVNGDFVVTNQKIASVEQALDHMRLNNPGMSVYLDCKETTPEAMVELLLARPELRQFTALKLYAKAYAGGFDQFLGNLYERHGIDPTLPEDRSRRLELRKKLASIKVVPVLSQSILEDPQLNKFFPPAPSAAPGAEALASSGMAWLHGWTAMRPMVVEAVATEGRTQAGQAMQLVRQGLGKEGSGYARAALAAPYRYEDFSVAQQDGSKKYFTWQIFGGIKEVGPNEYDHRKAMAGAFRHDGENLLTDQPEEETWAIGHDVTLPRGHTGLELDVPPGTPIDLSRNAALVAERAKEFLADDKRPADEALIRAVRAAAQADGQPDAGSSFAAGEDESPHHLAAVVVLASAVGMGVGAVGWHMKQSGRRAARGTTE